MIQVSDWAGSTILLEDIAIFYSDLPEYEYMFSYTYRFIVYEPFGLGRFVTGHSLKKAASRPLFARVRRYAPQRGH